jgi:NAD(P)-dependent dehydrogenase (short-subunit alcohol dehydrogenase family)
MTWTTADIPDLSGRVALVTGANGGLGLETARALAGAGAHVVMGARNQAKAAEARNDILGSHPDASLEITELDLGSLQSVEDAATKTLADHGTVDILVNNAGVMAMPEGLTGDGFETQFGINHLGHWALTAQLMPGLLKARKGRVVTVSSTAHHFGRTIDPANPHLKGTYDPWRAYGNSKLANYHFALGLQRQFEAAGVKTESLVAHPGLTNSDLQANTARQGGTPSGEFWRNLAEKRGMAPARGALSQLRAATDPTAKGGQMYAPRYVQNGPPVRRPILRRFGLAAAIDNLWEISERETGIEIRLS